MPVLENKWVGGHLEPPEWLASKQAKLHTAVGLVSAALDLTLASLEVAKAFSTGAVDPTTAALELLAQELAELSQDLRKAGLYAHGDWALFTAPHEDLHGGYREYERRMVGRLQDRQDPNHPNVGSAVEVLGVFFYTSTANSANINDLLKFIRQILKFFGQRLDPPTADLAPADVRVQYGSATTHKAFFRDDPLDLYAPTAAQIPDAVRVSWTLANPTGPAPVTPLLPMPSGFLVEVSTLPEGLPVHYRRPLPHAGKADGAAQYEQGEVLTEAGFPLVLWGGADQVDLGADLGTYNSPASGVQLYGVVRGAEDIRIPLDELKKDGVANLLQQTFYVEAPFAQYQIGTRLDLVLGRKVLPLNAKIRTNTDGTITVDVDEEKPARYYVRVRSVSPDVTNSMAYQYRMDASTVHTVGGAPYAKVATLEEGTDGPIASPPSNLGVITFPAPTSTAYVRTLATALALAVLTRADLSVARHEVATATASPGDVRTDFVMGTVATDTGLERAFAPFKTLVEKELGQSLNFYLGDQTKDQVAFRRGLWAACLRVANAIYARARPAPELELRVVEEAKTLTEWVFSSPVTVRRYLCGSDGKYIVVARPNPFPALTIQQALESDDFEDGLALFSYVLSFGEATQIQIFDEGFWGTGVRLEPVRTPGFSSQDEAEGRPLNGSADYSPIIYHGLGANGFAADGAMAFVRNIIPSEVYAAASLVLYSTGASTAPLGSGWVALRAVSWLEPVLGVLDVTARWVRAANNATKSTSNAVLEQIQLVEARIEELNSLLLRIDSLLALTVSAQLTAGGSMLIVDGKGIDGVIQAFLTAEGKPVDTDQHYGAGVVVLFPGLPSSVATLLKELFEVST